MLKPPEYALFPSRQTRDGDHRPHDPQTPLDMAKPPDLFICALSASTPPHDPSKKSPNGPPGAPFANTFSPPPAWILPAVPDHPRSGSPIRVSPLNWTRLGLCQLCQIIPDPDPESSWPAKLDLLQMFFQSFLRLPPANGKPTWNWVLGWVGVLSIHVCARALCGIDRGGLCEP